jgi:transposase
MKPQPLSPDSGHYEVASDGGAEHWAVIASLIETCKLNNVDPRAFLASTITEIVNGHPNGHLDEILPWPYSAATALKNVA